MMTTYLVTIGLIFAIMLGGIAVERLYRRFAASNPQLGPFRDTDRKSTRLNSSH
jgi:Na+/glutamate symporter